MSDVGDAHLRVFFTNPSSNSLREIACTSRLFGCMPGSAGRFDIRYLSSVKALGSFSSGAFSCFWAIPARPFRRRQPPAFPAGLLTGIGWPLEDRVGGGRVTQWIKGPPSIAQVAQHEKDHPAFVRIAGPHSEAQVRSGDGSEFDKFLSGAYDALCFRVNADFSNTL